MRPSSHHAPILLSLAGGLFLAALAVPEFWGGLKLLRHERTLPGLAGAYRAEPVSPATLADAVVSWRAALPWLDSAQAWSEYGDVLMAASRAAGSDRALRRRRLDAADDAFRQALARDPADGHAWTLLASTTIERDGTPEQVMPLLWWSIRTAPHEPDLIFTRLDIAFYLWRVLEPALKAAMAEQVLIATHFDPERLARLVRRHYLLEPVRAILDADPQLKWNFDEWYMRLFP